MKLGKRGLSPLISTILLIALAVAIGAMIMNWSSNITTATDASCAQIELKVQQAFEKDMICFNAKEARIKLVVKNTGASKISSIIYRKISTDFTSTDIEMPNSALEPGKTLDTTIGFMRTEQMHIEFIPQIISDGKPLMCVNQTIVKESLEDCPTS